jgi:two-component system LytT family response regulator
VHVAGEAASVADAARLVNATGADVVFLDIQLAGETGMDLLPLLGPDVDVVFVTAYDEHALRAFEVNALDYLLKPVAPERLAVTVSRLGAAQPPPPARESVTYEDRLFLRLGQERAFVRVRDIAAIEADGDGSTLLLAPRLVRKPSAKSLGEWEKRLPERQFVRIHRSTIVNLEYVERLEPWSHSSQRVYLRGLKEPVTMSRRFGARLRDRFG